VRAFVSVVPQRDRFWRVPSPVKIKSIFAVNGMSCPERSMVAKLNLIPAYGSKPDFESWIRSVR
jgi:hypothetical protein